MAWISEIKKKLKIDFISRLEKQFWTFEFERLLKGFEKKTFTTIRINFHKISVQEVMEILREKWCQFERIKFLNYSLILKNKKEDFVENLELYKKGLIYLQNLSSQMPVYFLNPKEWEKILDISAAPGSKTTQIAMITNWKSEIIANDIDEIRCEKLKYNCKKQGFESIEILNKNWAVLWWIYEWKMDKVLLDAPCSAEWRIFLQNPKTYKFWSEKNISKNKKVQKQLFKSAFKSLKKWWKMIYSTCTLAPEENEEIVSWALEKFWDEIILEKVFLENFEKNTLKVLEGFWEKVYQKDLKKFCLKCCPWDIFEGFFIAKFNKS